MALLYDHVYYRQCPHGKQGVPAADMRSDLIEGRFVRAYDFGRRAIVCSSRYDY
jgi:hypothetical protein